MKGHLVTIVTTYAKQTTLARRESLVLLLTAVRWQPSWVTGIYAVSRIN